jgi:hypothetical protein
VDWVGSLEIHPVRPGPEEIYHEIKAMFAIARMGSLNRGPAALIGGFGRISG